MSEFPSNAKKKTEYLSTLILTYFMLFSSFILSHPLYFAYFIFFSPYLFKILSFLSPLFATTSLLLFAIFTLTPTILLHGSNFQLPKSNPTSLLSTFLDPLQPQEVVPEDDFSCFQVLQAFKLALESSHVEIRPDPIEDPGEMGPQEEDKTSPTEPGKDHRQVPEAKQVKSLVAFFQEKEKLSGKKVEKEVKPTNTLPNKGQELFKGVRGSKALEGEKEDEARSFIITAIDDPRSRLRSASSWGDENGDAKQRLNELTDKKNFSQPLESYHKKVGTLGSMRREEKEWRRTLACKLFEERNNGVDGGAEGMDLLWETYETETTAAAKKKKPSPAPSPSSNFRNGSKKGKNSRGSSYSYKDDDHHRQSEYRMNVNEDYDEDESSSLCCLQAFKLSAGKMNLGMGRPGIVKITKALKGFGWLHHHVVGSASPRRTKKTYHQ